jgi:hypothetical protein
MALTTSVICGWSVVAAPTKPTFFASSGINDRIRSFLTMRIPSLVERRITQYVQPRWQPRSGSIRNMLRSSVWGVMICEKAGRVVVSALSMGGRMSPCTLGTNT